MNNDQNLFSHREAEPEESVLYVVGTPIGNLNDISSRAINILNKVSVIACEDTRNTGKFLKNFDITNKLISYHKFNSSKRINYLLTQLKGGASIALVSDAGMPLISDPGELLVKEVKKNGFDIICVPGACAALLALISSGFTSSQFAFYGFMPKSGKEREILLETIADSNLTTIIYESPKRLIRVLKDLKTACGGSREIVVMKELTKKYEQHFGSNIDEILDIFSSNKPKGEFTIVISRNNIKRDEKIIIQEDIKKELIELINAGLSHSAASKYLSKKLKKPKKDIYKLFNKNDLK